MALVEGVPEEDILKIKQEKITDETIQSIRTHGWLPDMFRQIIRGAKDFLQEVIFKFKLPPKPVPKIDLQEWKDMQKLDTRLAAGYVPSDYPRCERLFAGSNFQI